MVKTSYEGILRGCNGILMKKLRDFMRSFDYGSYVPSTLQNPEIAHWSPRCMRTPQSLQEPRDVASSGALPWAHWPAGVEPGSESAELAACRALPGTGLAAAALSQLQPPPGTS